MKYSVGDLLDHLEQTSSYVRFEVISVNVHKKLVRCARRKQHEGQSMMDEGSIVTIGMSELDNQWFHIKDGLERILEKI